MINNTYFEDIEKLRGFLNYQKESLVYEYRNNMTTCLSATTKERLFSHAKQFNWKITSLPKTNPDKVYIIKKENVKYPEIWVSSTYTKYREAFNKYLINYFDFQQKIPRNYHVDHSTPKLCFKNNYPEYFIRLFLVDRKVNCSFGATYEKTFYQFESNNKHIGGFHVSMIEFLKIFGIPLVPKNSNEKERDKWALKTSMQLEENGLEEWKWHYPGLLDVVYFGYKNLNIDKTIITDLYIENIHQKHIYDNLLIRRNSIFTPFLPVLRDIDYQSYSVYFGIYMSK